MGQELLSAVGDFFFHNGDKCCVSSRLAIRLALSFHCDHTQHMQKHTHTHPHTHTHTPTHTHTYGFNFQFSSRANSTSQWRANSRDWRSVLQIGHSNSWLEAVLLCPATYRYMFKDKPNNFVKPTIITSNMIEDLSNSPCVAYSVQPINYDQLAALLLKL